VSSTRFTKRLHRRNNLQIQTKAGGATAPPAFFMLMITNCSEEAISLPIPAR
jgi:hypothetical protein